jgi:hypothetical protein
MTDRLALATRVRKARRASICTICRVPITIGQPVARLISPPGCCGAYRTSPTLAAIRTKSARSGLYRTRCRCTYKSSFGYGRST